MGRIVTEHWLRADLTRVFTFFSDPQNLPRLMPASMGVRLESLQLQPPQDAATKKVVESGMDPERIAGPGSLIQISFRLVPFLPIRGKWIAEILEYEPLRYFLDRQRSGPMKRWEHRHSFRAESRDGIAGTVVRDEVDYKLPFGPVGHATDALLIQRMMQRTFSSRQKELERLLLG
jgi:ligand-binding SRPBCC domain-containing protein